MTLSEIQQSFYSRTFDLASVAFWLTGVAVLVLLALMFLAFQAARRARYKPHGSITNANAIRATIKDAFDQRRPFEIQIQTQAGKPRPMLRCTPEYCGQNQITLEINGLSSLSDRWVGRQVIVFFRVLLDNIFRYYTFTSHIGSINMPREGICHITLPMPAKLENRQKRAFLRIAPPREFFLGAALWCDDALPAPESRNSLLSWPKPKLLLIPGCIQQFEVLDLSAGGARVSIASRILHSQRLRFNTGESIILMLDLLAPEKERNLRFWLLCRIQNMWREYSTGEIQINLLFRSWARPREVTGYEEQADGIEWLHLQSSNEVDPLGNWIMRRHLEVFRDSHNQAE